MPAAEPAARDRLAVWGDPIAHSKSPALHAAAYRQLGLDWTYGRQRVDATGFPAALGALGGEWRGLSLTMPLKEAAWRAATIRDEHASLTGAVNTLLLGDELRGFNTDVGGILDALAEHGIREVEHVRILGSGATAASALVAASDLGARGVEVRARRPERAAALVALGERLGVPVRVASFTGPAASVDLTFATLPTGTVLEPATAAPLADGGGALFEAAYAPWPSALAADWHDGPVVSGLAMLLHQAVRQVRVFLIGAAEIPLDGEAGVLAAMRAALDDRSGS